MTAICPICRGTMRWINERFICPVCGYDDTPEPKPVTNADRIRSMSDEELAHLLHSAEEHLFTGNLWNYDKWTEWLKQEMKDE